MFALGTRRPTAAVLTCAALYAAFALPPSFAAPADPAHNRPICTVPG